MHWQLFLLLKCTVCELKHSNVWLLNNPLALFNEALLLFSTLWRHIHWQLVLLLKLFMYNIQRVHSIGSWNIFWWIEAKLWLLPCQQYSTHDAVGFQWLRETSLNCLATSYSKMSILLILFLFQCCPGDIESVWEAVFVCVRWKEREVPASIPGLLPHLWRLSPSLGLRLLHLCSFWEHWGHRTHIPNASGNGYL